MAAYRMATLLSSVIGVVFLGLLLPAEVTALPFLVIDQRNDAFPITGGFGFGSAPLGQEFTPSLAGLDTIEILIGPRDASAVAVVNVRQDSIAGPVIGTSLPGTFGATFIHFDFAALVGLVPGNRYVIEPVMISGFEFGPAFSNTDTYSGGRAIVSGTPLSTQDMGFREGLAVPEPTGLVLLCSGIALLARRVVRNR